MCHIWINEVDSIRFIDIVLICTFYIRHCKQPDCSFQPLYEQLLSLLMADCLSLSHLCFNNLWQSRPNTNSKRKLNMGRLVWHLGGGYDREMVKDMFRVFLEN